MSGITRLSVLASCATVACASLVRADDPRPIGIYTLAPAAGWRSANVTCVSGDGMVVGGNSEDINSVTVPTLWDAVTGQRTVILQPPTGVAPGSLLALNGDGSVALGYRAAGPYRFTGPGTVENLVPPPGFNSPSAYAMSANGIIAGLSFPNGQGQATRWTTPQTGQSLGVLPGATNSIAQGISADGSVVVGYSGATPAAFRWTNSGGMQSIGTLPGLPYSNALGVSGDGSVVVGIGADSGYNRQTAFRWTASTGMQSLGWLPGGDGSAAQAASFDGSVIIGGATISGHNQPVIWLAGDTAPRQLGSYMQSIGIDVSGWTLYGVTALSHNGRVLVGYGYLNNQPQAFLAVIPAPASSAVVGAAVALAATRKRRPTRKD